jgi:DNA-binding CsgD family transcriptional regulator
MILSPEEISVYRELHEALLGMNDRTILADAFGRLLDHIEQAELWRLALEDIVRGGENGHMWRRVHEAREALQLQPQATKPDGEQVAAGRMSHIAASQRQAGLSPRLRQLEDLVIQGLGHKDIAFAMGLSPNTTKFYLHRLCLLRRVSGMHELTARVLGERIRQLEAVLVGNADFSGREDKGAETSIRDFRRSHNHRCLGGDQ